MKKGCFKLVIFVPIFVGISIYIIDKYGKNFWDKHKTNVLEYVTQSVDNKFKEFIPNKYSDSLKTQVIDYFNTLKNKKIKDVAEQVDEFYASMKIIVKDSIISELDFKKLKKILDNHGIEKKIGN